MGRACTASFQISPQSDFFSFFVAQGFRSIWEYCLFDSGDIQIIIGDLHEIFSS